MRTPLTTRGRAALLVICGAACAHPARADDPFQPGLRWRATPDLAQPSIPKTVTFAKGGNFLWSASNGPFTRLQLFSAFDDGRVPAPLASLTVANASGSLAVAAGDRDDALFALVQVPSPDSTHRATLVTRYSATLAASTGILNAAWTFDSGLRANGPARLGASADGTRVFVANWNGPMPEVRFDVLDAQTGASLSNVILPAAALNEMCVSADGTRALIAGGLAVWIVDQHAIPRHQELLPLATSGVALSGDGVLAAIGGTRVRVLAESASSYAPVFEVLGNPGEVATRVALSRNGRTLAIGWWNAQSGVASRFEVVDVATHARLFEHAQAGLAGGPQNAPEVVRVTPDGERAAFGAWGDGTSAPDVLLYDHGQNALVMTADLPGSVFALDLDFAGRRVAVGMKGAHANQFAASGEFRLYDTGEAETTVLAAPRIGSAMEVAAHLPGASMVAFLSGPRTPAPVTLPGASGTLRLDRAHLMVARRTADASGRADWSVAIPNDPLLIGSYRHLQSAFFVNGSWTLGAGVIDVIVY